ncbi:MAG: uracil-DNA glycosylase [Hyphomicrobiales bacterium]|nr:uracil-DNA glycosylase [Hyphomicrobiales bacterium]MDE2017481.1 uracil-DNA glycosylase [Hyphomicrobiales bacterium]
MTHPIPTDGLDGLRWQAEMGVDLALDEGPRDRFAEAAAAETAAVPAAIPLPSSRVDARRPSQAAPSAVQAGEIDPGKATDLDELRAMLEAFDGCGLKATATRLAFADGTPGAPVMFVGEGPGAEEDRQGKPFVGPAGRLLDAMMAEIGLDRTRCYIANVVPWRPPGNRTPTPLEIETCLPFLRRQIALARPRLLVTLGAPAMQGLLGVKTGIMQARGRWVDCAVAPGLTLPALPMLHPAFLLRQPAQKRAAWTDWRTLARALQKLDGA